MTRLATPCLFALLLSGAGCSGDGLRRATVSGRVLVDNVPLAEGAINFFPIDGTEGPSVGAIIKDGTYAIPVDQGVIIGKNRVEIRGFAKSGRKMADAWHKDKMVDELIRAVPSEFNDNSTLVRDIQAGDNTLNFDLPGIKK